MKSFWLFRSNLRHNEYYHNYTTLEEFSEKCHDYYLLMGIWFLENNYFDEVIIWRLTKPGSNYDGFSLIFDVSGKQFIQRWVSNFSETLKYPSPEISFWRGGFKEYDVVTKQKPDHFGIKLYLGAGHRIVPQWGGKYDYILMEDKRDFRHDFNCKPFYKTASPKIFHTMSWILNGHPVEKNYDICWPCNFAQIRQKGQEDFIRAISQSEFLKSLKIAHCGNKKNVGGRICKKFGVTNIEFHGELSRPRMNNLLNYSKFGLNNSNRIDGCPRVSTEILMSSQPLLIRNETRLLPYFKRFGVVEFNMSNIAKKIEEAMTNYDKLRAEVLRAIEDELSFDSVTKKNVEIWKDLVKKKGGR